MGQGQAPGIKIYSRRHPGSGILFVCETEVANLVHRVLQAKLVIAEAFGSFVIRGDVSQIDVGLYKTRSVTEPVRYENTFAEAIS